MKHLVLLGISLLASRAALAQGSAFTYQGRLDHNGAPANGYFNFEFRLHATASGGSPLGTPVVSNNVPVSDGLFNVRLDFGPAAFNGLPRWLEIAVAPSNSPPDPLTTLVPRVALLPTPYAIYAGTASNALNAASATTAGTALTAGAGSVGTLSIQNGAITAAKIASGEVVKSVNGLKDAVVIGAGSNVTVTTTATNILISAGSGGGSGPATNAWNLTGNAGTSPATHFVGTADGAALRLQANGGVGVNTATPRGALEVLTGAGSVIFKNDGGFAPGLTISNSPNEGVLRFRHRFEIWPNASGTDFGRVDVRETNGTVRVYLPARGNGYFLGGNFGVGTASPQTSLDVNGRVKMTEFQLGSSATAGQILTANASGVGSWQTPSFVLRSGDTLNGDLTIAPPFDLNFGATTRQMINLWNSNYGIGVQNSTLYQRSDDSFAWFRDGSHANGYADPGAGGTLQMLLSGNADLYVRNSVVVDDGGSNDGGAWPGLVFGSGSGEAIASARVAGSPNRYGLDFYTAFQPRLSIANNGNVGIRTTHPAGLLDINTGNGNLQVISDLTPAINLTGGSNPGIVRLRNALEVWPSFDATRAGRVDVRDTNGNATITLDGGTGEATVRVLHITGGADIAEPFPISGSEAIPSGAVVVIDEERPGQLKLSERAYDTRVAGIVSGANGVQPGLALHQQGRLEGGRHVALSGRVYALADATSASIRPGDLLTTSDTPGHVMKVQDRERGHGAILGKAMTGLAEGKGLVLVLVSLQ